MRIPQAQLRPGLTECASAQAQRIKIPFLRIASAGSAQSQYSQLYGNRTHLEGVRVAPVRPAPKPKEACGRILACRLVVPGLRIQLTSRPVGLRKCPEPANLSRCSRLRAESQLTRERSKNTLYYYLEGATAPSAAGPGFRVHRSRDGFMFRTKMVRTVIAAVSQRQATGTPCPIQPSGF